jgi:NAD(P)-dependent dehydrogenase (short-subunit alcohol dehydrogenase family)
VGKASDLGGKWALVTGASRGIGAACAVSLAARGADVAVHYHESQEAAEGTAAQVEALGRRALLLKADLSQPSEIASLL